MMSVGSNFMCGRPHGAYPPVCRHPFEPDLSPPPCGRHKWMANIANSWIPTELKKCTLENPSLLVGPLAQYLRSHKRWVLSHWVTCVQIFMNFIRYILSPFVRFVHPFFRDRGMEKCYWK